MIVDDVIEHVAELLEFDGHYALAAQFRRPVNHVELRALVEALLDPIRALTEQVEALNVRIAALEAAKGDGNG